MKTKPILSFFLLVLFASISNAQMVTFQKTYGGSNNEWGLSVQATSNGGYIIAGITRSFGSGIQDGYLFYTDASGSLQWTKAIGGSSMEGFTSVQQTFDGGFIMAGTTQSYGAGLQDFFLVKTDISGTLQWSKTFGGTDYDMGNSVQQTSDGGYIISGIVQSYGAGLSDIYLIKTDASGNNVWMKTYGGADADEGFFLKQANDGGYVIAGRTESFGNDDIYLVKTFMNGTIDWAKTYGGSQTDYAYCVQRTTDGGYIITGSTASFGAGSEDVYLVKTDASGNLQWTKTYGGTDTDYGYYVLQTSDGGYIITGITYSFGAGEDDVYVIKTDASGGLEWSKTYGGTEMDEGSCVRQTLDGGYIISANTASFGAGMQDAYLIKTDALGNSGCHETTPATITGTGGTSSSGGFEGTGGAPGTCTPTVGSGGTETSLCFAMGIDEKVDQASMSVFPNPVVDISYLEIEVQASGYKEITIYNSLGSLEKKIKCTTEKTPILKSDFVQGIYFYQVISNDKIISSGKFIIR